MTEYREVAHTTCTHCYAEVLAANLEGHLLWHGHIDRSFDIAVMSARQLKKRLGARKAGMTNG